MELLLHVVVALVSVAYTTYACISPTRSRLHLSYVLIGLTLLTGTYLAVLNPGQLLQACISGVIYVTVMSAATTLSRYRMTRAAIPVDE